jgi:hypothetical protein
MYSSTAGAGASLPYASTAVAGGLSVISTAGAGDLLVHLEC